MAGYNPHRPDMPQPAMDTDAFKDRIHFVVELARHLHAAGTSVNRLEGALERVSQRLGLEVSIWSNPTWSTRR